MSGKKILVSFTFKVIVGINEDIINTLDQTGIEISSQVGNEQRD